MADRKVKVAGGEQPQEVWDGWRRAHADVLEQATGPQRVLLEALVRFVAIVSGHALMIRVAAFFALHTGMGLTPAQVGLAVGRTARAMRNAQALSVQDLLDSLWNELRRHRQPKLRAEHAGPIAKYLVEHPHCTQPEVVAFIASEFGIQIDPQTLRRFFKTYTLGVLRPERGLDESTEDERPFALGAPTSEAPFYCYPSRSR